MDGQLAALYSVVRFWSRRLGFPPIWPVSVPQILTAPCLWAVCYGCSEMGFQHDWMEFLTIARSESLDSVSVVISQLLWGHNIVNTYFMYFYVILCPHVVFWRALAIDMRFDAGHLYFSEVLVVPCATAIPGNPILPFLVLFLSALMVAWPACVGIMSWTKTLCELSCTSFQTEVIA